MENSNLAKVAELKPVARAMHVLVTGKVQSIRRHESAFYTVIVCPAADAYSRPSVVEVRSRSRIGDRDELVTVTATLGGYQGRSYAVVDKETGERRTVTPINLTLDLADDGPARV